MNLLRLPILLSIFLSILFSNNLNSQDLCPTPYFDFNLNSSLESNNEYYLKIYYHVIRRSDGTGGQSRARVLESLSYMDIAYNPHDIYFVWDGCIDFIDEDDWFNATNPSNTKQIFNVNAHTDGIDIYLFDDYVGNFSVFPSGLADVGGTAYYILGTFTQDQPFTPWVPTHTASHEMGHLLSLVHTHDTRACNGDPELVTRDPNTRNCEECGDKLCDTPADPGLSFFVNPNTCEWQDNKNDVNGDPYDPDEKNIMSYSRSSCLEYFSPEQVQQMKNALESNLFLQATFVPPSSSNCFCPDETSIDIVISNDIEYNEDKAISGDIKIVSGGTLTISSDARLTIAEGKKIIVERGGKLIIRDATITKCPYGANWEGIFVEGKSDELQTSPIVGVVDILDSKIQYCNTAIGTWKVEDKTNRNYWGGLVLCENTVFKHNEDAVSFMPYENPNISKFSNCFFEGDINNSNDRGVIMNGTRDIEFTENTFSNFGKAAIMSDNSSFSVTMNNHFSSNNLGIHATASSELPVGAINVEENNFTGNHTGILAGGISKLEVLNNSFSCNSYGVSIFGRSFFLLKENNFHIHPVSVDLNSTDLQRRNRLECNTFSQTKTATRIYGNNGGFTFDYESYNAGVGRCVQILGEPTNIGSIRSIQRKDNNAPLENSFSDPSSSKEIRSDIGSGTTRLFQYHHPAPNIHGYYKYIPVCDNNPPSNGCYQGNNYENILTPGSPVGCPGQKPNPVTTCASVDCLISIKSSLNALLSSSEESMDFETLNSIEILQTERELATQNIIALYLADNNYEALNSLLNSENSDNLDKMKLISVWLSLKLFDETSNQLELFIPNSEDELDFKNIQELNLSSQINPDYELSEGESSLLASIISKRGLFSGQAMSILSRLNNQVFHPVDDDDFEEMTCDANGGSETGRAQSESANLSFDSKHENQIVKISPNPANSEILISITGDLGFFSYKIVNMVGTKVREGEIFDNKEFINVNNLADGVYFVVINNNQGFYHNSKFLITK